MNEEEFRKLAKEKGYGEVELYEVGPGPEEEMHAHDHSVLSLVLSGEFTMTTDGSIPPFSVDVVFEESATP